ncbi:MAG: FtsX-like permease family protein [Promethearchaeota archaeon]
MNLKFFIYRLELMLRLSHVNLKLTAITLVGLTIGLSILSAAFIHLDSTKADYYFTTLEEVSDLGIKIRAFGNLKNNIWDTQLGIRNEIETKIGENNLASVVKEDNNYFPYFGVQSLSLVGIHGLNDSILAECIAGSHLPQKQNEVLVFVKNITDDPISLNDQVNISSEWYESEQSYEYRTPLTAVGLLTSSSLTNKSILADLIEQYIDTNTGYCFINSMNYSFSLVQTIQTEITNQHGYNKDFEIEIYFNYILDLTRISKNNAIEITGYIYNLQENLNSLKYEEFLISLDYSSYLNSLFHSLFSKVEKFNEGYISLLIYNIPVLLVVALLISFSLGLINERRKSALVLLKRQGVTSWFIFIMMFTETTIIAICSAVFALITGIPLSLFIAPTTGLLLIGQPRALSELVITFETVQNVFLIGFFFTFLFHLPSLVRLSRLRIFSLAEEAERKKIRKIRVLIGRLDLIFLVLGFVGSIAAFILLTLLKTDPEGGSTSFYLIYPFLTMLVSFSPIFVLIGILSTLNRFMQKIIYKLGRWFWRRDWRALAIATRNLGVDIKVTSRTILLIAITLALIVVFSILPITIYDQSVDNLFYTVGSEINLSFDQLLFDIDKDELNNLTNTLNNVTGFSFTVIYEATIYTYYAQSGYLLWSRAHFMGIKEDFTQVAHWRNHYDDESLETLVSSLFEAPDNNSVILDSVTMNREGLTIGSNYTIDPTFDEQITLSVHGVSNYWPRLINRWNEEDNFFVTRFSYIEKIMEKSYSPRTGDYTILGKIDPEHNREQVITNIKRVLIDQGYPTSILTTVYDFDVLQEDNIINIFFWFIVNINLLAALVIILSAIILFTITRSFRHSRELALSRSLGMKFHQLLLLMFTEQLVLLLVSGIPSIIAGAGLTLVIVTIFETMMTPGAPLLIQVDIFLIVEYYILVFLITLLAGFVTSIMAARANISKILKME